MRINNACIRCDLRERGEIAGPCYEGCQTLTRAHQVYRSYAGGSIAIDSAPIVGRRGLLTLDEARKVAATTNPEAWIGTFDGVKIVCVEISEKSRAGLAATAGRS